MFSAHFLPFTAIISMAILFPTSATGQSLFPPIYPASQQRQMSAWPYPPPPLAQQQQQYSSFSPPYAGSAYPSYGPFSPYSRPNEAPRSAFAQGIENGFGQLFPRYPNVASSGQLPSRAFGPFPHRFIPMGPGPNNYNGYGTNNWAALLLARGGAGPFASSEYATNQFITESLFDRENFQSRGCGWDQARVDCADLLGICKGGCQDFSFNRDSLFHDCRCVPVGYSALLMGGGKRR